MPTYPFDVSSHNNCDAIRKNIETVSKLEEKYLENRSFAERVGDAVGAFCGSFWFIATHAVVLGLWIAVNLIPAGIFLRFDPFPFMLLSMVVSIEAIFLSTFVLMKQNRMSRRADARSHLDLQINLLAEKELTMALEMLHMIGTKLGLEDQLETPELKQLRLETPIEMLATELQEKLPD